MTYGYFNVYTKTSLHLQTVLKLPGIGLSLRKTPVHYVTNNRFVQIFGRFSKLYILESLEPTEPEK